MSGGNHDFLSSESKALVPDNVITLFSSNDLVPLLRMLQILSYMQISCKLLQIRLIIILVRQEVLFNGLKKRGIIYYMGNK